MIQIVESVARYIHQLESADRQEQTEAIELRTTRLKEKLAKPKTEMSRLENVNEDRCAEPDQQISLTDPDARSMATSGRGSGVVGYNVQAAVDTKHHLIVAHDVTTRGSDRSQLAPMSKLTKQVLEVDKLDVVADRGYFSNEQILECAEADITVTLPKPRTSASQSVSPDAIASTLRFVRRRFVTVGIVEPLDCNTSGLVATKWRPQCFNLVRIEAV